MRAARAKYDGAKHPVYLRVGGFNDKIYIDLCDETGRSVEVDASGWRIVPEPPIRFFRKKGMLALPTPVQGGSISLLEPLINTQDEDGFVLLVAWILMALHPAGPYPVLVFTGEHGTSKSTLCKLLRKLIDPNFSALRTMTNKVQDLFIAANNAWIVAFDNLSSVMPEQSDALCRLATGGGYATRTLYTDDEEYLFEAMRPIMLNGIGNIITRGDLADRALVIPLKPIPDKNRKTEKELWQEIDLLLPRIFGALLNASVQGCKDIANVKLVEMPRMADFAKWATACETAFWESGRFKSAFDANRSDATDHIISASPIASALRQFMEDKHEYKRPAAELFRTLTSNYADEQIVRDRRYWPTTPRVMSEWLNKVAPQLRLAGIEIKSIKESGTRLIHITRNPAPPPPTAPITGNAPQKLPKYARKPTKK